MIDITPLAAASASQSTARLGLAPCDGSADQAWTLAAGGWGANYTIQRKVGSAQLCFDVANWATSLQGAAVNGHVCCTSTAECKHPQQNYNEQWMYDKTNRQIRAFSAARAPSLCLDTSDTGALVLNDCIDAVNWQVSTDGAAPLLKLASDPTTCIGTFVAPGPAPSPADERRPACTLANTTSLPFCDTALGTSERAKDLVARMTLEEKLVQLIGGIGGGTTPSTPRLGVPAYEYHNEGLHGIRSTCVGSWPGTKLYSTLFPQVTGMAATGNLSLIRAMAAHMADEARAANNMLEAQDDSFPSKGGGLNYWGPTLNIGRDPRWGRLQESVSEDPWLNGAYSSSFVKGLQGDGDGIKYTKIAACCKHFYAYSLEGSDGFSRHNFDALVTKRDLAETYLPPFAAWCVSFAVLFARPRSAPPVADRAAAPVRPCARVSRAA